MSESDQDGTVALLQEFEERYRRLTDTYHAELEEHAKTAEQLEVARRRIHEAEKWALLAENNLKEDRRQREEYLTLKQLEQNYVIQEIYNTFH